MALALRQKSLKPFNLFPFRIFFVRRSPRKLLALPEPADLMDPVVLETCFNPGHFGVVLGC